MKNKFLSIFAAFAVAVVSFSSAIGASAATEPTLTADNTSLAVTTATALSETASGQITSSVTTAGLATTSVTLTPGSNAYNNVRIQIVPESGTSLSGIQVLAQDTEQNWFDIVNSGWGPASGFPVQSVTMPVYIVASQAGTYHFTAEIVDVSNDGSTVVASSQELVVTATAPTAPTLTTDKTSLAVTTSAPFSESAYGQITSSVTTAGLATTSVTLTPGSTTYNNARIQIVPESGTSLSGIQVLAQDTEQNWFDIVNSGWGPASGFPVQSVTMPVYVVANKAGTYHFTAQLVDVSNGGSTVVASSQELVVTASVVTTRIAGSDRYATAVKVAQTAFPSGAGTVYIASGSSYADALAVSSLAGKTSPILLVGSTVPAEVRVEIAALKPTNIVIVGGTGAVSAAVENALKSANQSASVSRIAGANRYDTAAQIATKVANGATGGTVVLCSGLNFADAMSIAPVAAMNNYPILFTTTNSLPTATSAALAKLAPKNVIVVGGTGVVSASIESKLSSQGMTVTRLSGANRYETSSAVVTHFASEFASGAIYVTGANYPDALSGAPLAALYNLPIVIVDPAKGVSSTQSAFISGLINPTDYAIGGTAVLSDKVIPN